MSNGQPGSIPKWREDFPIESDGDDHITRRDFLRFLTIVSAGFATGSGYVLFKSMTAEDVDALPSLDLGPVEAMEPASWRVFSYPDEETHSILVRRENGDYVAFLQKCPHLACPVIYHAADEHEGECFTCHCHNGRFDVATGAGTQGPPRELRPLRQVALKVEDGRILAVGLQKLEA